MEKELNYKLTGENTELIKGESSQKAIENQSPKGNVVNTITVDEVKELDKKADSKQDADLEELKKEVSKKATIHEFDEGTILTDEILAKVKSGDIVKVLQMEFVVNNKVNQTPRAITGKMLGADTILELNWIKGQELEPTVKHFSSNTLLGSTTLEKGTDDNVEATFSNIDLTKITSKTLLIFTAMNCFVIGMLSQTGEGIVAGVVPTSNENKDLARVRFNVGENSVKVTTSASFGFGANVPTAYLFAFSVI